MVEFADRVYLELTLQKSFETDDNGNPIVWAEASNENLDLDGQIILQRALLDTKDHFLKNGVISYDHKHIRDDGSDKNWNPEKYIIGKPMDVIQKGKQTFVKALLYKSNDIVKELLGKLKDGAATIKTSVGGKRPVVSKSYDKGIGKAIEKVVKVLWDELAITFKPVNDTLTPVSLTSAQFVKSLEAGYSTDPATMTGGAALIKQDLQGAANADKSSKKNHILAVVTGLAFGDLKNNEEAEAFLKDRGCTEEDAKAILGEVIKQKTVLKGVFTMAGEEGLSKALDESIEMLEKSLKPKGGETAEELAKAKADAEAAELAKAKKAAEDKKKGMDNGGDDYAEEEVDPDLEEPDDQDGKKKPDVKKSVQQEIAEDHQQFLDASPVLAALTKSVSDRMDRFEKTMAKALSGVYRMQKSVATVVLEEAKMLKSIGDTPRERVGVLQKSERNFTGGDGQKKVLNRDEIIDKSNDLMKAGKMSFEENTMILNRLNKGLPLSDDILRKIAG